MGDRCYLAMRVLFDSTDSDDIIDRVEALFGNAAEAVPTRIGEKQTRIFFAFEEVNYGGYDAINELTKLPELRAGTFGHTMGDTYAGAAGYLLPNRWGAHDVTYEGDFFILVDRRGRLDKKHARHLRKFLKEYYRIYDMLCALDFNQHESVDHDTSN